VDTIIGVVMGLIMLGCILGSVLRTAAKNEEVKSAGLSALEKWLKR